MAERKPTQITTGKVRFSYVHVFEPYAFDSNPDKAQYSMCLIIDKSDKETLAKVNRAIKAAQEEGKPKWGNKLPANLWNPLRDGDVERPDQEEFQNAYFMNAKSNRRPQVVDRRRQPILDEEDVYSGCYGRVSLTFFAFAASGNKGVGVGLNNVQKLQDGARLGGGTRVEDDFDDLDDEEFEDDFDIDFLS